MGIQIVSIRGVRRGGRLGAFRVPQAGVEWFPAGRSRIRKAIHAVHSSTEHRNAFVETAGSSVPGPSFVPLIPNEIWLRTAVAIRSQIVANTGRREAPTRRVRGRRDDGPCSHVDPVHALRRNRRWSAWEMITAAIHIGAVDAHHPHSAANLLECNPHAT